MQLWFTRQSEVSIRDQLTTQIVLGIVCQELGPGQRLPSTRELARRFDLHPNTVSAAYRQLEREHWVEFRHGSGVYVCETRPQTAHSSELMLDQLIAELFRSARKTGAPLSRIRTRLRYWAGLQRPGRFLVLEPDQELRRILVHEIQQAVTLPVEGKAIENAVLAHLLVGAVPLALPNTARMMKAELPPGCELLVLQVRSVTSALASWLPAPASALVGIVSSWRGFLDRARTVLIAAGFHPDCLLFRDARGKNWRRGLDQAAAIVCDSLTASSLPEHRRVVAFPLLSDSCLNSLRAYQHFLSSQL